MKKFFGIGIVIVTFMLSWVQSAGAAESQVRRGAAQGCLFGPRMAAKLQLTPNQQTSIAELREQMDLDLQDVYLELDKKREKMRKLWATGSPREDLIFTVEQEMDLLRKEIRQRRMQFRLDVIGLLTPQQKKAYAAQVKLGRDFPGPGRGWGRGCGRGWGRGGGRGWGPGRGAGCGQYGRCPWGPGGGRGYWRQ